MQVFGTITRISTSLLAKNIPNVINLLSLTADDLVGLGLEKELADHIMQRAGKIACDSKEIPILHVSVDDICKENEVPVLLIPMH